jgi:hypothetical protein
LLPTRTVVARSCSPRQTKKPAAPFGTAGDQSFAQVGRGS